MKTVTMPVIACHDTESIALSLRATTRNPLVKLLSKLFAFIGLIMMFAISGWGAQHSPVMSPDTMSISIANTITNNTSIMDVNATDSDGNALTYSITAGNSSVAFAINSSTGIITVLDNTKLSSPSYTLSLTVTDSTNRTDTGTVSVTVSTPLSLTTPIPDQVLTQGSAMTALDMDNYFTSATSYTIVPALSAGLSYNSTTHVISGTPSSAMDTIEYTVTATKGGESISDKFTITVNPNYASASTRPFTKAYSTNAKGNIKAIGNPTLGAASCTTQSNNDVVMNNINLDGAAVNSTSSNLILPAGVKDSDILYAALYWQGRFTTTDWTNKASQASTVKLKLPGSTYQTISTIPTKFNQVNLGGYNNYQGVADITSLLKNSVKTYATPSGYSQTIWVADVLSSTNNKNYFGGWSIVIVYKDAAQPLKNLTVYDGYVGVNPSNSQTVTLSGFLTPSSYPINASFLIFGGEGDKYYGDQLAISGKTYGDVFSSSILDSVGANIITRDPACANTLGVDIHNYNIGKSSAGDTNGVIDVGQSSATINLTSLTIPSSTWSTYQTLYGFTDTQGNSYDTYYPGVFAFATDIYAPQINITKTPSTSGPLSNGQKIDYTGSFINSGLEVAKDVVLYDDFTQNILKQTDGSDTSPRVSLADMIQRNATAIKQSIRLSSENSTSEWHCPVGVTSAECVDSTANCSVDYTGDPATTATKVWCSAPTEDGVVGVVRVGKTYTMKFSINLSTNPECSQDVSLINTMYATYKNKTTDTEMPEAVSNTANAGSYISGGGAVVVTPPTYQNNYGCGMFGSVLTSYDSISSGADHPANHDHVNYTGSISYPPDSMTGEITCNASGETETTTSCERVDPPANKLEYTVTPSSKLGTVELTPSGILTGLEYGNFNGNFDLTLAPLSTYGTNSTPVMVLGDVTLTGSNVLTLAPGDYFFNSLTFTKSNPSIVLNNGGSVRIFIQNNFTIEKNGLNINATGEQNNLFVYIKGNLEALSNGAIETWKGFFYVEGSAKLDANAPAMKIYGGITAEGPIIIEGNNGSFYQQGSASDLGYGACQLCYAVQNDGALINFSTFASGSFNFPRTVAIPNISGETLTNTSVSQDENTTGFGGSMGCYQVVNESGTNMNKNISISGVGHLGDCAVGLGNTTVTADFGSYVSGGMSSYDAIKTNGFTGTFMGSSALTYNASYTSQSGKNYNVQLGYCQDIATPSTTTYTGLFDAWETNSGSINDRNISTKISNQNFNLTIASINADNNATETKSNILAKYRLFDVNNHQNLTEYTDHQDFNASTTPLISWNNINISEASKNTKVQFQFCADYNGSKYTLKADSECNGKSVCTTLNTICYRETVSMDNFAIRPANYIATFAPTGTLKAGNPFVLTLQARGDGDSALSGYDGSATITPLTNISTCPVPDGNFTDTSGSPLTARVFDGVDSNTSNTIKFGDVGDFNLTVTDSTWTAIDSPNGCIADSNATTPVNNLVGCLVKSVFNAVVIPDHFGLSTIFSNASSNGFTYLSSDLNMSSNLKPWVTAQALGNTTTKNYNSSCYAKNTNYKVSYINNPSPITPSGSLSNLVYLETNSSMSGSVPIGSNFTILNMSKNVFTTDNNGTAQLNMKLNFDRNQTKVVNPFDLNVTAVDVNDTDNVLGHESYSDKHAYFVYGRFIPRDIRVFGNTADAIANAWYEVYNAPTLAGTALSPSRNDALWYINKLHNDTTDGDANVTYVNTTLQAPSIGTAAGTDGMEEYNFGHANAAPYSAKAHINTESWLWYGQTALPYHDPDGTHLDCLTHPCLNINIVPPIGSSGSMKSTSVYNTSSVHTKVSKQTTTSGLTYDYAPAVQ